jgi:hypothetical protein
VGDEEETWMMQGALEEHGGAGTTGEKWYVTPLGVVRHSTADLSIGVTKGQVTVSLKKGSAYLWPGAPDADDAGGAGKRDGWDRIDAGSTRKLEGEPDALRASKRCSGLANEATRLAAAVQTGDAALGEAAAAHVIARRQAHAGCALARMLAEEMGGSAQKTGLLLRISVADRAWKTLGADRGPEKARH